jgi:hypothetical protein
LEDSAIHKTTNALEGAYSGPKWPPIPIETGH